MSDPRTVARNNAIKGISVIVYEGKHQGNEGKVIDFKGNGDWVVDCGNNEIFSTRSSNCMVKFDKDDIGKMKALADYYTSGEGKKLQVHPYIVVYDEGEKNYIEYEYDEEEEMFANSEDSCSTCQPVQVLRIKRYNRR